jgi:hypothetical protein
MRLFYTIIIVVSCNLLLVGQERSYIQKCPAFSWLNQTRGERPKYVWENMEDIIYHEIFYPDSLKQTAPEFYALMRCPWVFNRAMRWDRAEGTVIAGSADGSLELTGINRVSEWYSDPDNSISHSGNYTLFSKSNAKRQRDCAVMPSFQFHLGQHPVMELEVLEANADWQFCASVKGRSGPPVFCSGWQTGTGKFRFDISAVLENAGYTINFAEMHFVMGTWTNDPSVVTLVKYKAELLASPSVVACLPVTRTVENARENSVPVTARVTNHAFPTDLVVKWDNQQVMMEKRGDYYSANLPISSTGTYLVEIVAGDSSVTPSRQVVRVTDGSFYSYDAPGNFFIKNNKVVKPLTGSYQGSFFVRDCGMRSEQMVMSQAEWDNWDRSEPPGERLLSWESLTPAELSYRFAFLEKNNWDLLHLHSHYGIWERFDAVGNLAPHGIEQFALYTREAERHGMHVMVTLSSYPYGVNNTTWDGGTCPYYQYIEAGFKNEDWYNPLNEPFRSIYHRYLSDFISLFKDETAIFSLSSSGEGDWKGTWKRFDDTREVIRSIDTNHIIVSEPIMSFEGLPSRQVEKFRSDLVGYRNYALGSKFNTEEEMAICTKLAQIIPNSFIAEGSFPASNVYTCMTFEPPENKCWAGTDYYRVSLRDWLYMGFLAGMPAIVTWDEAFTEDERLVLDKVRQQIDWSKPFAKPPVAILLNDTLTDWDGRPYLAKYERVFSRNVIGYRFIESLSEALPDDWLIDPSVNIFQDEDELEKSIPRRVLSSSPFRVSPGYSASYLSTTDKSLVVSYIYNTTSHDTVKFYLSGNYHRVPEPRLLEISGFNVKRGTRFSVYDLNTRLLVREGVVTGRETSISLGTVDHDFILLMKR